MYKCWKCGNELDLSAKVSFRAICAKCSSWQHCCRNCKNYQPGLPNDCKIPGTDFIADREGANFCEEFQILGVGPSAKKDPNEVSKRLFGDDQPKKPKNPFDDLFKS